MRAAVILVRFYIVAMLFRHLRRGDDVPHSVGDSVQRVGRTSSRAIRSGFDGNCSSDPASRYLWLYKKGASSGCEP